jgi:hypothetical protein
MLSSSSCTGKRVGSRCADEVHTPTEEVVGVVVGDSVGTGMHEVRAAVDVEEVGCCTPRNTRRGSLLSSVGS